MKVLILGCCLVLSLVSAQEPAKLGEFPFQVSIRGGWDEYGDFGILHVCSGTIIGERWVLTSASCCNGDQLSSVQGAGKKNWRENPKNRLSCLKSRCLLLLGLTVLSMALWCRNLGNGRWFGNTSALAQ